MENDETVRSLVQRSVDGPRDLTLTTGPTPAPATTWSASARPG
ncbi:hypothetical protein ABT160_11910 [Streptomyces sp. NPDC001941]